jgi:alpha-glucosidase
MKWSATVVSVVIALVFASAAVLLGMGPINSLIQMNQPSNNPPATFHVTGNYTVGNFVVAINSDPTNQRRFTVTHQAEPKRVLWESLPGVSFVGAAKGAADIREVGVPQGSFDIRDQIQSSCDQQSVDTMHMTGDSLVISGTLTGQNCSVGYALTFSATAANQLRFVLKLTGNGNADFNRLYLRSASAADEHVFGLGQQLTYFDQKGQRVPILVQEHGVGRGLPVFTEVVNLTQNGGGGSPTVTEAPAPHYLTSNLRSLFLENEQYSLFDLRHADRIEITLFSNQMTGRILYGQTPLDLIEAYTAYAGRMRPLPDWMQQGAIISVQGGTDEALKRLDQLSQAGVPISAFWFQDWTGVRKTSVGTQLWWNWQLDETQYPNWDGLVGKLKAQNIRTLIYMNPFLVDGAGHDQLYKEAAAKGYLVKQRDGTPYPIRNTSFSAGMIDLSNPEARTWIKQVIKDEMITRAGASGWMRDFGEALPFDAVLSNGADPAAWHNHYPDAWAEVNREAIEEAGRGDDIVFFDRSAFTRSPGSATLFWLGDQLQTWDEYDGIKTAVVGMLSGGVSGFSLTHSDTGGYNAFGISAFGHTIPIIGRSRELLMRWTELSAWTSALRTHVGLNPGISAQIWDDDASLAHFARMTKLYKALGPYRTQVMDEAARTGHPVVRHPFLEFPNDPNTYSLRYQFMLGSEFMVAPVVDAGAQQVRLYLPAGAWVNLWTAEAMASKGQWVDAAAPLGKPAVFFKQGSAAGEQLRATLKAEDID